MNTEIDNPTKDTATGTLQAKSSRFKLYVLEQRGKLVDTLVMVVLTLVALLPRILLSMQLDMVTDEVVYILGGKLYLPLAEHLDIGASGWLYNYEHPPFVKLLIGLSLAVNTGLGHPLGTLFAARLPSMLFGTVLVVSLYWLAKAPFGRLIALGAALCLAFSPWLVYFSALAYLDMTMTALITLAYLVTWYAIRRPQLSLVVALLVGLGAASKYTAVLVVPGIALFTAYYFLAIRPLLPAEQRPRWPWLWWLAATIAAPLIFLAIDMAIWPNPLVRLKRSFLFEWNHSVRGHLTFLAGQYSGHVPHWAILYIIFTKISAFVTVPAIFFTIFAAIQLIRFHLHRSSVQIEEITRIAFLFIWLVAIIGMFSLLNIVVGTHYHLPTAAPVALAGACGLAELLRMLYNYYSAAMQRRKPTAQSNIEATPKVGTRAWEVITPLLLLAALAVPHLVGLLTIYGAEGYTSEFFAGENSALQVAYPGYRDAVQWLASHQQGPARIGLVALPGTLNSGGEGISWYDFNKDLPARFQLAEAHPGDKAYTFDYLVWPMHLVQRGYAIPEAWRSHILYSVMGGDTVYCFILANPSSPAVQNSLPSP